MKSNWVVNAVQMIHLTLEPRNRTERNGNLSMRAQIMLFLMVMTVSTGRTEETKEQTVVDEVRELLESTAKRVNDEELAERREFWDQLTAKEKRSETFEEYVEKYASFAKLGSPAGVQDIDTLRNLSAVPLPPPLVAFYQLVGSFESGYRLNQLTLFAPERVIARSRSNWNYEKMKSMGLVDMVVASWGGDRPEFQRESGAGLKQDEIDRLNAEYSIFGWRAVYEGEGYEYLYFDTRGNFGALYYHQDGFDDLYAEKLRPMLSSSPATQSLADVMKYIVAESSVSDLDKDE